jgi:hypothetical protein
MLDRLTVCGRDDPVSGRYPRNSIKVTLAHEPVRGVEKEAPIEIIFRPWFLPDDGDAVLGVWLQQQPTPGLERQCSFRADRTEGGRGKYRRLAVEEHYQLEPFTEVGGANISDLVGACQALALGRRPGMGDGGRPDVDAVAAVPELPEPLCVEARTTAEVEDPAGIGRQEILLNPRSSGTS